MHIRFFRDERGRPSAVAAPPAQAVGWFLEQDVRREADNCLQLLQLIDDLRRGKLTHWDATGNAHALTLTPEGATIENLFAPGPVISHVTLDELEQAVRGWLRLITTS